MNFRDILRVAAAPILTNTAPEVFGAGTIGGQLLTGLTAQPTQQQAAPMQTALPMLPAIGGAMAALGASSLVRGAIGVIRSVGGRIMGIVLASGQRVSVKSAVSLAKSMGVTAAATALGIGAVELAEMVMQEQGKARRGKGVTASQLKTTRRTMRTVEKMHRQIAGYCRDAGVRTTRFVRAPAPSFGKRCK